ncbi:MAG: YdbL family protein [Gammaproteobacteria bacterium]|jgi:uncharacterized protein|nr:YdbL family protein [Gammaproteobacteria bacterium]MBT4493923.1 YdbL family protein [Gammaproteobacteria bacterium]MBT7369350.1 YdbL family protein [Gammaproteobacteria bacterium]
MTVKRIIVSALLVLMTQLALADLSLNTAKAKGLVGEDANGYLAAVDVADGDVSALIDSVNSKREKEYGRIARSNNIERSAVEQLAGKKAIEKTKPGQYVRLSGGAWKRK